jgi:hypothetical protein
MQKNKKIVLAITLLLALATVMYSPTQAATSTNSSTLSTGGGGSFNLKVFDLLGCGGDLACLVNKIIDSLLIISIPVVALMVIIGGMWMATSGGDSSRIQRGKSYIYYAAGGYAVLIMAKGVALIIQEVLGAAT